MQQKVICVCKICGKEYEGYKTSRYCAAGCKKIADRENMRRHYAKEKVKRAEAKARAAAIAMASLGTVEKLPKPEPEPKPEPVDNRPGWLVNPDREQCVRCKYSSPFHSQSSPEIFCDYMKKHADEMQKLAKEQGLPWGGRMERRKHDGPVCLVRCEK